MTLLLEAVVLLQRVQQVFVLDLLKQKEDLMPVLVERVLPIH